MGYNMFSQVHTTTPNQPKSWGVTPALVDVVVPLWEMRKNDKKRPSPLIKRVWFAVWSHRILTMCKSISMHKNVNLNLFSMIQGRKKIIRTHPPSNNQGLRSPSQSPLRQSFAPSWTGNNPVRPGGAKATLGKSNIGPGCQDASQDRGQCHCHNEHKPNPRFFFYCYLQAG